ncbi:MULTISPECIES: SDR family NAD(P)-dependent oxidoreductase [Mycobacterium]|uniref:Oxidoreductase n=1 Tax=Mycobacterium kiyosense TaxID=2871094 RepID=A0A9P3Q1P2_9MYCO|nr:MULTISPECIES: SDR family NAD(P)-dependent oxidoreductase [Mycobacterium]BDB41480.1 oxidoreductase [Mycobacterium kiyosense]BDE15218.1 oxidoreductase [Mycobacterium sp. 20KCMC460]GLB81700.1 oxidoreductase [Mycobacterium kiyosense]GLB87520.1 oxidoreductase [Mycobacterium kiyosense]GLB94280.1 oxidoreductase [Mycobacterium kiyosense]
MNSALVTGASTGLGRELAALFAADGVDLVVVSSERSATELAALADELRSGHGVRADPITMDLSAPGAGADLVSRVDDLGVDVEYLVNNAGVGILGLKIQECDPAAVSRMVQLNVVTLTDLTTLYAARMVKAGHGAILNISSIAAYVIPHGLEAGYSASKAYVRSFSEAVASDLHGTGVTCTHLAPGPTRTEFGRTAGVGDWARLDRFIMDAAPVAKAGYEAMRAGKVTVMPGLGNKVMRVAAPLSPSRRMKALISGYFVARH